MRSLAPARRDCLLLTKKERSEIIEKKLHPQSTKLTVYYLQFTYNMPGMRTLKLACLLLFPVFLNAQISAVDAGKGAANTTVTDIVVAFKMHVDIGYTDWAE